MFIVSWVPSLSSAVCIHLCVRLGRSDSKLHNSKLQDTAPTLTLRPPQAEDPHHLPHSSSYLLAHAFTTAAHLLLSHLLLLFLVKLNSRCPWCGLHVSL